MTNIKLLSILLIPAAFMQLSCKKWLDVKPKSQIESDVLYQRESGFKDVLTGAYINMASTTMYGREMTWGMVDVIGHAYAGTGDGYRYLLSHQYDNTSAETIINASWQQTYNSIANLNNLIEHLRIADKSMFAADNYNVILGEAIGLRAFLHFDMLRLFAPSYKLNPAATAIPYVTKYGSAITPDGTVESVLNNILTDLDEAEVLLKQSDPIITNRVIDATVDEGYLMQRNYHLNYYAVKAEEARVYLYMNNLPLAAAAADEVIAAGKFQWTKIDDIAVTNDALRDRTFTSEQVFVLNTPKMSEAIENRLSLTTTGQILNNTGPYSAHLFTADINALYPGANDWRKLFFFSQENSGANPQRYCTKLWQPAGMPVNYRSRLPMVRLPELFLISAEAALGTNSAKTISRLRELRTHRGLEAGIPDGTPDAALNTEIIKEYRRELLCEGQLFYCYKRIDATNLDGLTGAFDKTKYVLPRPAEEIEFR